MGKLPKKDRRFRDWPGSLPLPGNLDAPIPAGSAIAFGHFDLEPSPLREGERVSEDELRQGLRLSEAKFPRHRNGLYPAFRHAFGQRNVRTDVATVS